MSDINNIYISNFKERLKKARKNKKMTQDDLADALEVARSTIISWENTNNTIFPSVNMTAKICSVLDVEPNYLLGLDTVDSSNVQVISDAVHLSYDNVKSLLENSFANLFIDFILSNSRFNEFVEKTRQICYQNYDSTEMENKLTPEAIKKTTKAFDKFFQNVFALDRTVTEYAKYLSTELPLKKYNSFEDFVSDTLTQQEYTSLLSLYPNLDKLSDNEKHYIIIRYISEIVYEDEYRKGLRFKAINDTNKIMADMINDFIDAESSKHNTGVLIGFKDWMF